MKAYQYFLIFALTLVTACSNLSVKQEATIALTYREALQIIQANEPKMDDDQRKASIAAITAYESAVAAFSFEGQEKTLNDMAAALAALQAIALLYAEDNP